MPFHVTPNELASFFMRLKNGWPESTFFSILAPNFCFHKKIRSAWIIRTPFDDLDIRLPFSFFFFCFYLLRYVTLSRIHFSLSPKNVQYFPVIISCANIEKKKANTPHRICQQWKIFTLIYTCWNGKNRLFNEPKKNYSNIV